MGNIFKYFGISIIITLADTLFCLFLAFLYNGDDNKWLPAFVMNYIGFVTCLTLLIVKAIG